MYRNKKLKLKEILKEKQISQTAFSEMIGKSFNMVNAYCQNRRFPDLDTLYLIADTLDLDVRELLVSNKSEETKNENVEN